MWITYGIGAIDRSKRSEWRWASMTVVALDYWPGTSTLPSIQWNRRIPRECRYRKSELWFSADKQYLKMKIITVDRIFLSDAEELLEFCWGVSFLTLCRSAITHSAFVPHRWGLYLTGTLTQEIRRNAYWPFCLRTNRPFFPALLYSKTGVFL